MVHHQAAIGAASSDTCLSGRAAERRKRFEDRRDGRAVRWYLINDVTIGVGRIGHPDRSPAASTVKPLVANCPTTERVLPKSAMVNSV